MVDEAKSDTILNNGIWYFAIRVELNNLIEKLETTQNNNLLSDTKDELSKVINELNEKINTTNLSINSDLLILQDHKRDELFSQLKDAINSKRPKRCEVVFQEIEKYQLNTTDKILFDKLQKAIVEFNFKKAIKLCEESV